MKKSIIYSLLASVSMITTAAYANDPDPKEGVLTTQRYVDDGLEFVYKVATGASNGAVKDLQTDVSNLQTDVGDLADEIGNYSDPNDNTVTPSGIKGDIEALQDTVGDTDLTGIGDGTVTGAISDLDDRVESLEDTVGDTNLTGIGDGTITGAIGNTAMGTTATTVTGAISELNTAVSNLNQNSSIDGANTGVRISNKKIQLDVPSGSANDDKAYVFQNGSWIGYDVETVWDESFLTGNP